MRLWISLFICFCIAGVSLDALRRSDHDFTLVPPPPEKSRILGVQFGAPPAAVARSVSRMGLSLVSQQKHDGRGRVRTYNYNGIPEGIALRDGKSKFLFVENELVRMDLYFKPTYKNFLMIREQLMQSFGQRFKVQNKKEAMEDMLRVRLAHLTGNDISESSESAIRDSMNRGNTFFHYTVQDTKNELAVTLSFRRKKSRLGSSEPQLHLHYSLKSGLNRLREQPKDEQNSDPILPQSGSLL